MTLVSAAMESFHVRFAVAVAATALRTPPMNFTACAAVKVCSATVRIRSTDPSQPSTDESVCTTEEMTDST